MNLHFFANEERSSRNYNYLSIKEIISELDHSSSRLYERDIKDEDFLMLRLDTKEGEPTYGLDNPFEKLELGMSEISKKKFTT
ncbi:hypothetical protein R2F61_04005 [Mollicutes bacterium LVI A0078]|nr:hypothetical protein RZE84_04025 [Mollicutes bacterium LVI A0075]WOO91726.1 hypothetical protein R2F61_04005 [Mollicutes bacterium LVI A0078]